MSSSPVRKRYLWHSFCDGLRGTAWTLRTQWRLWLHLAISAGAVGVGLWLRFSAVEWGLLVLALAAVFAAELANTALEIALDLLHPQSDPLIGRAKDVAAAAVVVAIGAALVVGALLLLAHWPP